MTIACKLWLLAVVCIAFLYQDGPQGNGVLCGNKDTLKNNSSEDQSSVEDDDDEYSDDECDNCSGGNDLDGGGVGKSNDSSDDDEDDNGDNDDDEEHDKWPKNERKMNKKSGHGKNHHDDENGDDDDDDDEEHVEDDEDDDEDVGDTHDEKHKEHHKKFKKNNDDGTGEMQILTSTTITGKPKDILKFLNKAVKPYKPVSLDLKRKSNSNILKKIEAITKSNKSSKSKKEPPNEGLTSFMSNILMETLKKKSSEPVDSDKVLITLVKSVLLQLLKDNM